MKKKLLALLLAAGMALCLSGCGDTIMQHAAEKALKAEPDASFILGQTYTGQNASLTIELASLSHEGVMAPMTADADGSVFAYTSDDHDDHIYLDCVLSVKNTGKESLQLQEDLLLYAIAGDALYLDCILLTETKGGTAMEDADTLESGASARLHYGLILPKDADVSNLDIRFMLPETEAVKLYHAALRDLVPEAASLTKNKPIMRADNISLTLKSAKITASIDAVSEAGGGYSLSPQTADNQMLDAVIEVSNNSKQDIPLGTLYGGLRLDNHFSSLGMIVLEANHDLAYTGSIKAGTKATTHLTFELAEAPTEDDHFYLYFDGSYYAIPLET